MALDSIDAAGDSMETNALPAGRTLTGADIAAIVAALLGAGMARKSDVSVMLVAGVANAGAASAAAAAPGAINGA